MGLGNSYLVKIVTILNIKENEFDSTELFSFISDFKFKPLVIYYFRKRLPT